MPKWFQKNKYQKLEEEKTDQRPPKTNLPPPVPPRQITPPLPPRSSQTLPRQEESNRLLPRYVSKSLPPLFPKYIHPSGSETPPPRPPKTNLPPPVPPRQITPPLPPRSSQTLPRQEESNRLLPRYVSKSLPPLFPKYIHPSGSETPPPRPPKVGEREPIFVSLQDLQKTERLRQNRPGSSRDYPQETHVRLDTLGLDQNRPDKSQSLSGTVSRATAKSSKHNLSQGAFNAKDYSKGAFSK